MARRTYEPDHWTYLKRYVRCTSPCATCASGPGHGPYWYRARKVRGRVVTEYIGKNLPEKVNENERQCVHALP